MFKRVTSMAAVVVACVLCLIAYSFATEGPAESVTQAVAKGPWERWDELVNASINRREAIVDGLCIVAKDDEREGEERIYAIILMGKTKSDKAARFLFENISLWIAKRHFFLDDDELKQQPCFYALRTMGWQAVPHALEFIEENRTPKELELVARVLARVCRAKVAKAILETKLQEAEEARDNPVRERNLRQLLAQPLRGAEFEGVVKRQVAHLGPQDRKQAEVMVRKLELCARTKNERNIVEGVKVHLDAIFFLRGGGTEWRSAFKGLEERQATTFIAEGLKHERVTARIAAAGALGRLNDTTAIRSLSDALKAENFMAEGSSETVASHLALKRELVAAIGMLTKRPFEISDYDDQEQIEGVISAAEHWLEERRPAIERLLSGDVQEIRKVRDELLADRADLIARLVSIIQDEDNLRTRYVSVSAAMFILGEMRATEAVEPLVKHIAFPWVVPPGGEPRPGPPLGSSVVRPWWRAQETHPAVEALVKIGEPCLPEVLNKLASTGGGSEEASCLCLLVGLRERDVVAEILKDAIEKETDTERRTRLNNSLNRLAEMDEME